MRPLLAALVAVVMLTSAARAGDPPAFEDAPLRAVQFVDRNEGWAVGDDGVVRHTIDGGKNWERQTTGVRASLRSLHFLNPYTGWIVGREELPNGGGSNGVILYTKDGGVKWQVMTMNSLPGLHRVRFVDSRTGFVLGDGCDQFPSGVFMTADTGRTWQPLPGARVPGWHGGDFTDAENGALGGAWNRLASVRGGKVIAAKIDTLYGRTVRDVRITGKTGVAVGQGGLVLLTEEKPGATWEIADLPLSNEMKADLDFNAVACVGKHIWVAGRPGTVVLHSADQGATWEVQKTGQALPINGLHFLDDRTGWAVGEFGTVLSTVDGGKTWKIQRRGGQRAAIAFMHARPAGVPVEALAALGGEEGYLTTTLRVVGPDWDSAAPVRAADTQRLEAAIRMAGGASGEMLWQFPVPQHLARSEPQEVVKNWDLRLHANRAAEQLLRQLVLTIRMWQPSVIVTDPPDPQPDGFPSEMLVGQAVKEAVQRAADPKTFPEQITQLGLQPWQTSKLYACVTTKDKAQVVMDFTEVAPRLEAPPRDFAAPAAMLLSETTVQPPAQQYFQLLHSRIEGAEKHRELMAGLPPFAPGGLARRAQERAKEPEPELVKAFQTRRNLQALAELPPNNLVDGDKLLSQIKPALQKMPDQQAALAAFAIGQQYARQGQWLLARETFLMLAESYPTHPLAADACRWLIRHDCSSETRRRQELKQFIMVSRIGSQIKAGMVTTENVQMPGKVEFGPAKKQRKVDPPQVTPDIQTTKYVPGDVAEGVMHWYRQGLATEKRLTAFGPLFASDPSIQFCLQAARRNLGDFDTPRKWYTDFAARQSAGPWLDAARSELWLAHRDGMPPKPVGVCRQTDEPPYLDGKLDEPCWQAVKPLTLQNAVGDTAKDYPTEAWLAHDQEFLYLALRCRHPEDRYVAPVKGRPRDADLRPYDRVGLMLDLDRDYSTYFHLQVDQRGCVCDDCWGDISWNPRWYVAVHSDKTGWQIEAAIPLTELSGEKISAGKVWAFNIVRVLPGRGVQAYSIPADVQPRPEGMGLLMFAAEPTRPAAGEAKQMPVSNSP